MVQLPNTGAIATMGNTGLGWGWEGEFCTVGAGDGWISSEFFKQYGQHYGQEGYQTLGQVYLQTQTSYVNTFKDFTLPECWWYPDLGWDAIDAQCSPTMAATWRSKSSNRWISTINSPSLFFFFFVFYKKIKEKRDVIQRGKQEN